jgi:hypothetical protein
VLFLIPFSASCQMFVLNLCWKTLLVFGLSVVIFSLTFDPLRNSVFEFYLLQGRGRYFSTKYVT